MKIIIMRLGLFLLVLLTASSCERCKERNDEELCSDRINNLSDFLEIHGFYYHQYEVNSNSQYEVFCLFRNGILLDLGVLDESEWTTLDQYLLDNNYFIDGNRDKLDWGIYSVSNSTISYEKWYPSNDYFRVYKFSGNLLSDSSFQILESNKCDGSEHKVRNSFYQFRPYPNRPDSTTSYIN